MTELVIIIFACSLMICAGMMGISIPLRRIAAALERAYPENKK